MSNLDDPEWTWPDPPTTPRDVIAGHLRNWGNKLAYREADELLIELAARGFRVLHVKKTVRLQDECERFRAALEEIRSR